MKLVVDANILFAAFIKDSYTRRLLLFSIEELFTPEFIYDEIKKHIVELKKKTGLSENQIDELFSLLIENANIKIVKQSALEETLEDAGKISPDPDDIHYFALAFKLSCSIWSNDKKLKEQNKVRIFTTEELSRNPSF